MSAALKHGLVWECQPGLRCLDMSGEVGDAAVFEDQ